MASSESNGLISRPHDRKEAMKTTNPTDVVVFGSKRPSPRAVSSSDL
jgi:hypothetical protein